MRACGLEVEWLPSPNFGARRDNAKPSLIVLHYTGMATTRAALSRLRDCASEVSAHFVISEEGRVWQLVEEDARAWHAGVGRWGELTDVNSHSIGIELANTGAHPFPEPQMAALEAILPELMERWGISPQGIIAHSDMAPDRKSDPGPKFDWRRLAHSGLSVWPRDCTSGAGVSEAAFRDAALRFGYPAGAEHAFNTVLAAFRMRFRPQALGPLDEVDLGMIADLAARFPIDRTGNTA